MKKELPIVSIDLGDVVFDRAKPKIPIEKGEIQAPCEHALRSIRELSLKGYRIVVISRISPGSEMRIGFNLFYYNLVPRLISPSDVHFCYERSEKGPIAKRIGVDIHVDDRLDVLGSIHESGIHHKILFTGSRDESSLIVPGAISGLQIANSWPEVLSLIYTMAV